MAREKHTLSETPQKALKMRDLSLSAFLEETLGWQEAFTQRWLTRARSWDGKAWVRVVHSKASDPVAALLFRDLTSSGQGFWIEDIFVCPEARSQGLGTRLVKSVLEEGSERGFSGFRANVARGEALGPFLARLGFCGMRAASGRFFYEATPESFSPFVRPARLLTPRLLLRPLELEDLMDVFRFASNPKVAKYTLWDAHRSHADTLDFIRKFAFGSYSKGNPDPYAMVCRFTGRVLGTVGAFWASRRHGSMELGYALAEDCWGQGFSPEASRAVINHAFESFQIERLVCTCIKENVQSAAVMRKLGFVEEGTRRRAVFSKGRYWEVLVMSLLKEDYFERASREQVPLELHEGG